jgi:hypothetical protein
VQACVRACVRVVPAAPRRPSPTAFPASLPPPRGRPPEPFEHWFYIHEWAPLIIFFGTYLGIVRNKKIPHVARYHIMMARPLALGGWGWRGRGAWTSVAGGVEGWRGWLERW